MQATLGNRFHTQPRRTTRPRLSVRPGVARALIEIAIIAAAVVCYFLVRGLVDGREGEAFDHARSLIGFERNLGIFIEPTVQGWALDLPALGTVANWIYIWGHWPVIVATLVWLLVKHRETYPTYRNALLISGGIGLIIFTLFPMAPPRFMTDWGFIDTVTLHSKAYRVLQPPSMVNQYAAMPSLHCGWDLLIGIAIARHASGRLRWIGYVLPVLMVAAVVLTANHYLLDAVVGDALVLASLAIATAASHATGKLGLPRRSMRLEPALG